MRIVTWNVNGIKTVPQYHPWNVYKCLNDILNSEELSADVVCMQEMKIPRTSLIQSIALPSSFDAFLSFPSAYHEAGASQAQKKIKAGYSGSGIYTRKEGGVSCIPRRAEAMLCFPPKDDSERISPHDGSYPGCMPEIPPIPCFAPSLAIDDSDNEGEEVFQEDCSPAALDSEGRSIILDFGLFVLVNVYCPNDGSGRTAYKQAYHSALQARVTALLQEGRQVMVVGDLNAVPFPIDHCEGALDVKREGLEKWFTGPSNSNARAWLRDWLLPVPLPEESNGEQLVDLVRLFHPNRKAMYTCWNTLLSARESNYGTRIDFILVSAGLIPWIKDANIMPELRGSDHCPVYVDLHESIQLPGEGEGRTVLLKDVFGKAPNPDGTAPDPPKLATRFWDEYSGKQMRLDKFFGGKATQDNSVRNNTSTLKKTSSSAEPPAKKRKLDVTVDTPSLKREATQARAKESSSSSTASRKASSSSSSSKLKNGQSKIGSFFKPPKGNSSSNVQKGKMKATTKKGTSTPLQEDTPVDVDLDAEELPSRSSQDLDADYQYALQLSQSSDTQPKGIGDGNHKSKEAWSKLLSLPETPTCPIHGEPCKKMVVNKKGPNKGRGFWICSRPVGPGYDRGKSSRPREEVDHQWRCDFFKWCKDRKEKDVLSPP